MEEKKEQLEQENQVEKVEENLPQPTFKDFNFEAELQQSLDLVGFTKPTPIQVKAIPIIQDGSDIIAVAQTGTGKTAAFLLPIMNKIFKDKVKNFHTLIISPTRELAIQIDKQAQGFGYFLNIATIAIHGGKNPEIWGNQQRALENGTEIVVGTPGRVLAHFDFKYAKTDTVKCLILDEADRMLDMGFADDLKRIIKRLPKNIQKLMFSATMPSKIRELAKDILVKPKEVSIAISKPAEGIVQKAFSAYNNQKYPLLKNVLQKYKDDIVIIFCSSKVSTKEIAANLIRDKFKAKAIHSDLEQKDREETLQKFVAKRFNIMVATDVMSRGIDIKEIGLVINFDVPHDPEDYIHRIGRTARANTKGAAVTFINEKDQRKFQRIEKLLEKTIPKDPLPDAIGKGPAYGSSSRGGGSGRRKSGDKSSRDNNRNRSSNSRSNSNRSSNSKNRNNAKSNNSSDKKEQNGNARNSDRNRKPNTQNPNQQKQNSPKPKQHPNQQKQNVNSSKPKQNQSKPNQQKPRTDQQKQKPVQQKPKSDQQKQNPNSQKLKHNPNQQKSKPDHSAKNNSSDSRKPVVKKQRDSKPQKPMPISDKPNKPKVNVDKPKVRIKPTQPTQNKPKKKFFPPKK